MVPCLCRDTGPPPLLSSHMGPRGPFYSATYGTFLIEFFIIIDLTCIILLALGKQILTGFDIRAKTCFRLAVDP